MKKYDVFLFDADDTLYDFAKSEEVAMRTAFTDCGFAYSESVLRAYIEINRKAWDDFGKGAISKSELQTLRFSRLLDSLGLRWDADDLNARYLFELGKGTYLIEGAYDICKAIAGAGKLIYIVTNGILATQQSRIKHSLIKDFVSDFFVSEFVGCQKPQKEYFDYVFAHIPAAGKDKMLIVGDSLASDIAGGNNAGIDTCWFNERGAPNDSGITPTYEIKELAKLLIFI